MEKLFFGTVPMSSVVRYFWNRKIKENVIIKSRNCGEIAVYTAQNSAFRSVLRIENWFELFFSPIGTIYTELC